jgi:putative membrane protein insertion efficiency factor
MRIALLLILVLIAFSSIGQTTFDTPSLKKEVKSKPSAEFDKTAVDPGLFRLLFITYKSFFSSQDGSTCGFHPTCSQYAASSLKQKGFIIGFLATFDRIARCHNLNRDHYRTHPETDKKHDPVD